MAEITLRGNPIHTSGNLPAVGSMAPDFKLTKGDLSDVSLADFAGKKKVLSIVPSLDTGVCATSLRTFNQRAAGLDGVVILNVSRDLPFAQRRFCAAEGIEDAVTVSEFRNRNFGAAYGIEIIDGAFAGTLGRAVVVLDEKDTVVHTELVPEISQEPNYDAALQAVGG